MQIPIYIFVTLVGILVGSFLNVVIYRVQRNEEFVKTPSHCLTCNHKLAWYDNIPLLSWIMLGGKCRYCKVKLSAQYPLIEAFNGLIWLSVFLINGINADSIITCLMSSGLLAMSMIDFKTYIIPDGFHIYFGALAIANLLLHLQDWLNLLIGIFCVSLFLLAIVLLSKGRAMGGGDVKLMASCGAILGWQNISLALMIGCIVGSIIHIIRMKVSDAGKVLAMGPYLAIGIFIAHLFGNNIIDWYLSLLIK